MISCCSCWSQPRKDDEELVITVRSLRQLPGAIFGHYGDGQGDRRQRGRGGRRRGDRGRPWWQKGLFLGALCALVRCWRWVGRSRTDKTAPFL
jgi:hypothetical protein